MPRVEQLLSTGAAAQLLLLAAHALGYAGIWRTGELALDAPLARSVGDELGLEEADTLVSWLYLGTAAGAYKQLAELSPADFFLRW